MSWKAFYTDGTCLEQFPITGGENKFGNVDMSKLREFCVEDFGHIVSIFPLSGDYEINGQVFSYQNFSDNEPNLELVYYRTHRHCLGTGFVELSHEYMQCIGLRNKGEANKKKSIQLLIEVNQNGVKIHTK